MIVAAARRIAVERRGTGTKEARVLLLPLKKTLRRDAFVPGPVLLLVALDWAVVPITVELHFAAILDFNLFEIKPIAE